MRIFFDKAITGVSKSFVWENGVISIDEMCSKDAWHFKPNASRYKSVLATADAAGCDIRVVPKNPHARFWMKHTNEPAWHRIFSRDDMTSHIRAQVDAVTKFMTDERYAYYTTQYQIQQKLLDSLGRIRAIKDDDPNDVHPDREGFAALPVYDNQSSSTGRMSIKAGPKILTMPRDTRKNFVSRWLGDGELIEIDFNALELRVLSWMVGLNIDSKDAYQWIASAVDLSDTPRHVIKEATLASMYGMSRKNFALRYQDMPDAIDVYEKVRDLLQITELDRRIAAGAFKNAFGRPLSDTTARVSHYVQSSAVDVACEGFLNFVENNQESVPCFLIHDALVVDVHKDNVDKVMSFCKNGLRVDSIDLDMPVRCRRFGSE
jgi:hypothetical protein